MLAHAEVASLPKDDVVEDVDPEQAAGVDSILRDRDVVGGWRGIAGRVIVHDDEGAGVAPYRLAKHLGDAHLRRVHAAADDLMDSEDGVPVVEDEDTQALLIEQ